ncbi:hypothetical protein GCM10011494_25710 [Novosphingobium endophyticum]|uniref:Uncharacterized protein n=1 Tax=Novosphingobium endophyticum TaxID=1955250 RepID=A0A916TTT1_9SPHN|nr:hypothetical protein [Novosphingobium endophyticum]GGC05963.1 hypothetical protein GCM10011494_25710 [Novosphingobium endophyticum]
MPLFLLVLEEDGRGEPKKIEFISEDPSQAFEILKQEQSGRAAVLWQEGKRLGTLQRTKAGVWELAH